MAKFVFWKCSNKYESSFTNKQNFHSVMLVTNEFRHFCIFFFMYECKFSNVDNLLEAWCSVVVKALRY